MASSTTEVFEAHSGVQVAAPRQSSFVLCFGSPAFLIVDLTFHGQFQWHLFQVQRQLPRSDGFACLGSKRSSLADRTGAAITGVVAKFQNSSSKLCSVFGSFEPIQQRRLHKTFNFGTAASYHGLSRSQIETVLVLKSGAGQL